MKRDPSIHITKLQFEEILSILDIDHFPTEAFFTMARKKAANTRVVSITTKKANKQITTTLLASSGDASMVADIIYATRIKLKHRGVKKITQSDTRNWSLCKKIAEVCNIFCNDFGLDTREGFIKYIEIGIQRLNGNTRNLLNRLPNMLENISAAYESYNKWLDISSTDKECCIEIQKYYVNRIADTTGIYESLENDTEKMIHFLNLYRLCQKNNWPPKQFIEAQFESLAWCNGLPDIAQLYTDKAIERYNKYLYKINHKQQTQDEDTPEVDGSLWGLINS